MKNLDIGKKYEDYIISMRRHFHAHPELSGKEEETVKRLSEELERMGISHTVIPNGGILAVIEGEKPGDKAVLLRADCDALPVEESADNLKAGMRKCVSENPGVMHACGHDGHMAMLLGAARILLERKKDFGGKVYLCFERGEEGAGNVKYIFPYIEKNHIHIDTVYGAHLLSTLETGKVGINDGGMMSGAIFFSVRIEGRGGHGSRPDQAVNPIDCFVAIYQRMQALRLTKIDPFKTCAYSVGQVSAGITANVIPDSLTFSGTLRTFDRDRVGMVFYKEFKDMVEGICSVYGCKAVFTDYDLPGYAVVNDAESAAFARRVIGEELGRENVTPCEPWMASESFNQYLRMWPGVFAFIGMKNDEKGVGAAHHNRAFDIDEDVLVKGSVAAATYAVEFLNAPGLVSHAYRDKVTFKQYLADSGRESEIAALYGEE